MGDPERSERLTVPLDALAERGCAGELSGEKRLMAAVLGDAMHAFLKYHPARVGYEGVLFREAQRWFASHDRSWLLAFENVCDVLGIDAGGLRRTLDAKAASGACATGRPDGRSGPKIRL
jgi:hypothetical protein